MRKLTFLTWTVLIKLVSPKAAQHSIYKGKTEILQFMEGPVQGHITEDRSRKKSSTQQELNPQTLCYEACALPLCFNCCPEKPHKDCPPWTLLCCFATDIPPTTFRRVWYHTGLNQSIKAIKAKHDKTLAIPIKTEWLRVLRVRYTMF